MGRGTNEFNDDACASTNDPRLQHVHVIALYVSEVIQHRAKQIDDLSGTEIYLSVILRLVAAAANGLHAASPEDYDRFCAKVEMVAAAPSLAQAAAQGRH